VVLQVADIIAKQRRVERQDKATVEGVSFDRSAANVFQQYCNSALAFSIKRGGICYGTSEWLECSLYMSMRAAERCAASVPV
jgi:hypothetical protein